MGTPWKKNLLRALAQEHRCEPPILAEPPYGHECAVCGKTVDKKHPLHRAERPQRSEVQLVSALPEAIRSYGVRACGLYLSQLRS